MKPFQGTEQCTCEQNRTEIESTLRFCDWNLKGKNLEDALKGALLFSFMERQGKEEVVHKTRRKRGIKEGFYGLQTVGRPTLLRIDQGQKRGKAIVHIKAYTNPISTQLLSM